MHLRRCLNLAAPVAIYLVTATLLELYWMRSAVTTATPGVALSTTIQQDSPTARGAAASRAGTSFPSPAPAPPSPPPSPLPPPAPSHVPRPKPSKPKKHATPATPSSTASVAATAAAAGGCWPLPRPFTEAPFNASMASVVWTRPLDTEFGPLDDVPEREREQLWPAARRQRLLERLPERRAMERTRFGTCAVVGSSPELLLYSDGAAIDAHDAVFRANMAVTAGYEEHAGRRTSVRIVNPVEDVFKARKRSEDGTEIIIKNQDPPVIRSPSEQHGRFLGQAEKEPDKPNYLGRRQVLELCNFLFVMSGLALPPEPAKGRGSAKATKAAKAEQAARDEGWSAAVLNQTLDSFRKYVADGRSEWHPLGPKIPRFSQSHCSTGTVLLVEALLLCRTTRLYGFHACGCSRKCGGAEIAGRNHYWDKKSTPRLDDMMSRYERHMLFYQLLERACGLDFRIARTEHCDAYPPS